MLLEELWSRLHGRRVCLSRDQEVRSGVRILQQGEERCTAVEGYTRNAGARVPNPVGLAEGRRGAEEQPLTLQLIKLGRQRASLRDRRAIVVATQSMG